MHALEALAESELRTLAQRSGHLFLGHAQLRQGHRSGRKRPGGGSEFLDFRQYAPGDDPRTIDWRSSARSRSPQVRRFVKESAGDWFILLDCSASMVIDRGHKWARAIQLTAALAYLVLHQDHGVALVLFSDRPEYRLPPGHGRGQYGRLLRALKTNHPRPRRSGTDLRCCLEQVPRRGNVIVISDFLAADGLMGGIDLLSIQADRLRALQILSDRDIAMSPTGPLQLEDIESGQRLEIDTSTLTADNRLSTLLQHRDRIDQRCRRRQVPFSSHWQQDGWRQILLNHLALPVARR